MRLRVKKAISVFLCGALVCSAFVGCHQAPSVAKLAYLSKGNKPLQYYEDVATEIAYPTESCNHREPSADFSRPPRLIHDFSEDAIWDLTLAEAIRIALENGAIIKDDGSFGSPGNPLFANPNGVRTAYDIAIQESGILFGNRGVEAALADFDAQTTTTMTWGRSEQIQNSANLSLGAGDIFVNESAQFSTQVQKQLANSGIFTLQHDITYDGNNIRRPSRTFPSVYTGFARATYRQPLLAGSGAEFTRIAGPIGSNLTGVSGVAQGVVISRINADIAIADFESSIGAMVRDVENRYWDLHLFYQIYAAESIAAADALRYWERLRDRLDAGAEQLAQALENYHEAIARVQNSLADINENESRLRRLMGLPPRGDRIIRPVDRPTAADFTPDWDVTLAEALSRRPEIRSQKWNIKSLELQLKAAKNLVRPRLDFVSQYQVNAFGDKLIGDGDPPAGSPSYLSDSAYESLANNLTSSWNLGFQLAFPIGFRTAHTQVRNYEFRIRKARTVLAAQEMEIYHELDAARKAIDRWYANMASNQERLYWSRKALTEALIVLEEKNSDDNGGGANTLNRVLQAHNRVRDAHVGYYQTLIEYNKAITAFNFRKGSTLVENSVHVSESTWCPSAYEEALRRAWSRTYAKETSLKCAEPIEFTQQAPMVPPLSAIPQPQVRPDISTSGPKPAGEKEPDDEDPVLPDGLNVPMEDDPNGGLGQTVRRTGYTKPVMRMPVRRPQARTRAQATPRVQSVSRQVQQLDQGARRTGDSKAG